MNGLRLGLFSMTLAMGGLPLYVHLPQFAGGQLGISLAAIGVMLLLFRLIDMVQDPFLGRYIDVHSATLPNVSLMGTVLMVAGFIGVFAFPLISGNFGQIIWLSLFSFLLVTGYSLLSILLYRQSSLMQETNMKSAARIREIASLVGVILGSVLPFFLIRFEMNPYRSYALVFAVLALVAGIWAMPLWRNIVPHQEPFKFADIKKIGATKLLALLFLNSLPLAITSTLFVFFVRERLALSAYTGAFLALFFLASMAGVIVFAKLFESYSARTLLLISTSGAILSFLWAFFLPPEAVFGFSVICVLSGLFTGCELYLLPVLYAKDLKSRNLQGGMAFGAWSFVGKFALALAAILVLPFLSYVGFSVNGANSKEAKTALAACYALLPSLLKLGALALVITLPKEIV